MLARFVNSLPNALSQRLTKLYFKVITRNQRQFHSYPEFHEYNKMDIKTLPALQDNYMYLIIDKATNKAAVVDPVEPKTVLQAVQAHGVEVTTVLTTHHHWDHAGGNHDLVKHIPTVEVYGGDSRIEALTKLVKHDDKITIGNLSVHCLFTPCHTAGHVCYYITAGEGEAVESVVFTGDTLFLGGCGRFFEGTADQMYQALQILGSLPDSTKVYCGHEYTVQNLMFAKHVEPTNNSVLKKIEWAQQRREEGKPTVPSTIGEEKMYNPFMRVMEPSVMKHANQHDAVETMKSIRSEKDTFTC